MFGFRSLGSCAGNDEMPLFFVVPLLSWTWNGFLKMAFLLMFSLTHLFVQAVCCLLLVGLPRSFLCLQLRKLGICLPAEGRTRPHILHFFFFEISMLLCSGFNACYSHLSIFRGLVGGRWKNVPYLSYYHLGRIILSLVGSTSM